MLTISYVLVFCALVCCLASAAGKLPLWIAVFFLILIELLRVVPRQ